MEMAIDETRDKIDLVNKRLNALQAQVDHLVARLTRV